MIVEPAGRDEFISLMRETYGHAMSAEEFEWWFDRNPPRILTAARENGTALGVLAMSLFRMDFGLAAYAVHAVTSPAARGKGAFSKLELHNEVEAAEAGAAVALGFTNPSAGPILVGKLGWEDVTRLRLWVRPKRLRPRREGRLRVRESGRFDTRHERAYRAEASRWGRHIVRDADYLNWRYADSPREYAVFTTADGGWAVATHAVWQGFSCAVVADAVGPGKARLVRRCAAAADADLAVAMPNPGEEPAYLAAGFVPTPRTIRFIGKKLRPEGDLPKRRSAWRFSLGDLDFF